MPRSKMQSIASKAMREELLKWICMNHATNSPLDRAMLKKKALELASLFQLTGFKCSEAWITLFLKRFGFTPLLTDCNGPVFEDYLQWVNLIRPLLRDFLYEDQFHVDELMMYTDFLSSSKQFQEQTDEFNIQNDSGVGNDVHKSQHQIDTSFPSHAMNRVTLLLASNISGTEKLKPLIGAPYTLEFEDKRYSYSQNESAKIGDRFFGTWLSTLNREMAANNRKIAMIMSRKRVNSMMHSELSHITLILMPNEFPTSLKPFRTDVFHFVKMIYRKKYVELLCETPPKAMWDPEEIVDTLAQAWELVPRELIVTNFQRTKFREDDSFLSIECDSWDNLMTGVAFKRFVTFDDDLIDTADDLDLNQCGFLSSVKENSTFKSSASLSSKINDEDQSRGSVEAIDGSSKKTSDDSVDTSHEFPDQSSPSALEDFCFSEPLLVKSNPKPNVSDDNRKFYGFSPAIENPSDTKARKHQSIVNQMDPIVKLSALSNSECSLARNTSTPLQDCNKESNRIYPPPDRTSFPRTRPQYINDGCFEEVIETRCLDSNSMNLDQHKTLQSSGDFEIRKNLHRLFSDSSPIASTSKALDDSILLRHLHERLNEENCDKIQSRANLKLDSSLKQRDTNEDDRVNSLKRKRGDEEGDDKSNNNNYIGNDDDDANDNEKRRKVEVNWAQRYEKQLVFGPDALNSSQDSFENSNPSDPDCVADGGDSNEDQEMRNKCIFTLSPNL